MQIEKVSRVMQITSPNRSGSNIRNVILSLPRVRWLERDPEYKVPGDIEALVSDIHVAEVAKEHAAKEQRKQNYLSRPVTYRQLQVYHMRKAGLSYDEIAKALGLSSEAVRHYNSIAKRKMDLIKK